MSFRMFRTMVRVLLAAVIGLGPSAAWAEDFSVIYSTDNSSAGTLRFAANNAEDGDTVTFNTSSVVLSLGDLTVGTAGTVTYQRGSAANVTMTSTSGSLNLGSSASDKFYVATSGDSGNWISLSCNLIGSGGLVKNGNSFLLLYGTNTYTGGTIINGGFISAESDSALGAGSLTIASGSTLALGGHSITVTSLSGSGSVQGNNGTLTVNNTDASSCSGSIYGGSSNSITLVKTGAGSLALTGDYSANQGLNLVVHEGSVTLGKTNTTSAASITAIDSGATVQYTGAGNQVAGGGITITGGTLDLNGQSESSAGTVIVNASTGSTTSTIANTSAGSSSTLGVTSVTLNANLDLNAASTATLTIAAPISGGYAVTKTGAGTAVLAGVNTYTGTTTISAGTLQLGNGTTNGSLASASIVDNSILVVNTAAGTTQTLSSDISGSGTVTKTGAGTLVLSGTNAYAGTTTISAGVLQIGNTSALGTSGALVDNGTLDLHGNSITLTNLSGSGLITSMGSSAATLTLNNSSDCAFSGEIGTNGQYSAVTLVKDGAGTLTLSGTADNSGSALDVEQGVVILGKTSTSGVHAAGSITAIATGATVQYSGSGNYQVYQSGSVAITGGTLDLNGQSQTSTGLAVTVSTAGSTITNSDAGTSSTLNAASVTLNADLTLSAASTATLTIAAPISGGNGVTKTGDGTVVLVGNSTYTGTTTISAGTLQLGNGTTNGSLASASIVDDSAFVVNTASGTSQTLSGTISGSGALTKTGAGTLVLTGTNTYAGTTTISTGTLQLGNGTTNGSVAGNIVDNATLVVNSASGTSQTISGTITGTGTFTKIGDGTLILTGYSSSFDGPVTISAGTLQYGNSTTSAGLFCWSIVDNGALVLYRIAGRLDYFGAISGSGTFTKEGNGELQFSGNNTYTGTTTINAGTLELGNGSQNGNLASTSIVNNSAFIVDTISGTSQTLVGSLSGSGTFTKQGDGTLILTGTNSSFSGTTTIASGTLQLGNSTTNGALGSTSIVNNSALVVYVVSGTETLSGTISSTGTVTKNGAGTLLLSGANSYSGGTTVSAGTLQAGSNSAFGTGTVTLGGGTLDVNGCTISNDVAVSTASTITNSNTSTAATLSGGAVTLAGNLTVSAVSTATLTIADAISGGYGLTKTGAGTVVLSGTNTYTGATTINAGVLQVGNDSALSGSLMNNNATLDLHGCSITLTSLSGSGLITSMGSSAGTLTLNNSTACAFSGAIGTSGLYNAVTLVKTGTGTLTLTGINDNSGCSLDVEQGAVVLGMTSTSGVHGASSITAIDSGATVQYSGAGDYQVYQAGAITLTGGALDLNGRSQASTSLAVTVSTAGSTITNSSAGTSSTLNAASVTLNDDLIVSAAGGAVSTASLTIAAPITGSGALTKTGVGTVILTGASNYTGATTISAGTLQLGNGATNGSVTSDIADNSALIVNTASGTSQTYAGVISGAGTVTKTGAGTLILTGTNTLTGTTTISAGTLQLGDGTTNGSVAGNIVDNSALTFNTAAAGQSYAGVIGGAGALTKIGAGTLTLTGTNTLTGTTTITAGALQLGNGTTNGSLAGNIVDNSALIVNTASSTSQTLSGAISGSGALTKNGAGTLILTGTSDSFTGTTTISAGTLQLGDGTTNGALTGSIANGSALVVNTATDTDQTLSTVISGSGTLTKTGAGLLELTGASSSFTGTTTVAAGELKLNGSLASSSVTVDSGATLSGFGTTGALTVNGNVAPGNSIGTLNVMGNYIQATGSTYTCEITGDGQADRIHATGTATLAGRVSVEAAIGGYFAPRTTYTILTADTGLHNSYEGADMNLAFLSGTLSYDGNNVTLIVTRSGASFADAAITRNQRAVATCLDTLWPTTTNQDLTVVMENLYLVAESSPADARTIFDRMSGEPYANLAAINMEAATMFSDAAFSRIWNGERERVARQYLWATAIGDWQHQSARNSYFGYDNPTTGFLIGYDNQFDNLLVGAAAGYGRSDVTFLGAPTATADIDLFNASVYGRFDLDALYFAGVTGYTHGWNDMTRSIAMSGMATRTANGSSGGDIFGLMLQSGYRMDQGNWRLTPLVGMRYLYGSSGSTTETGADSIDLVVSSDNRTSLSSHAGFRLGYQFNPKWRMEGYSQWEHEYADTCSTIGMAFTGDTTSTFTVQGVSAQRDGVRSGLIAVGQITDRVDIRLNYDTFIRSSANSHQLTGGLSVQY